MRSQLAMQLLLTLMLFTLFTLNLTSASLAPRFEFKPKQKFMMSRDDTWEVGSPSSILLFGKSSRNLIIKLVVGGGKCTLRNKEIHFFCSTDAVDPEIKNLASFTRSHDFCSQRDSNFKVSLRKTSADNSNNIDDEYTLSFVSSPKGNIGQIWIKVKVECEEKTLESEAIHLWNIDGLGNYNENQEIYDSKLFKRHFLQSMGLKLLNQATRFADDNGYTTIPFFDKIVLTKYKSLPLAVQSAIGFGVSLLLRDAVCDSGVTSMLHFSHSDSHINRINTMYFIDVDSGDMTFSVQGIAYQLHLQQGKAGGNKISICAQLYSADTSLGYNSYFEIVKGFTLTYDPPTKNPSQTSCKKVPNAPKEFIIAAGLGNIVITCPIICSGDNPNYQFNFGSKTIAPNSKVDWYSIGSWKISKFGNKLEFPSDLDAKLNGSYSCSAGGVTHNFDVKVLSLPVFEKDYQPPEKVVAVEGQPFQLRCKVKFLNIKSTVIKHVIQTNQMAGTNSKWQTVSLAQFNELVGLTGDGVMKENRADFKAGKEMDVSVAAVPPAVAMRNSNFGHRSLCKAIISDSDAAEFGMKSFAITVGTDVYFLARPKLSDFSLNVAGNDCRNSLTQLCTAADGAEFSVNVVPSLLAKLKAIGADIKIKFKIDNTLVDNFQQLFESNLIEITKDPFNGTASLKVSPIPEGKLRDEFVKMYKLTPIFEFYLNSDDTSSVSVSECSANKHCFYSTEFDEQMDQLYFILTDFLYSFFKNRKVRLIAGISLTALLILSILILLIIILRRFYCRSNVVMEMEKEKAEDGQEVID